MTADEPFMHPPGAGIKEGLTRGALAEPSDPWQRPCTLRVKTGGPVTQLCSEPQGQGRGFER